MQRRYGSSGSLIVNSRFFYPMSSSRTGHRIRIPGRVPALVRVRPLLLFFALLSRSAFVFAFFYAKSPLRCYLRLNMRFRMGRSTALTTMHHVRFLCSSMFFSYLDPPGRHHEATMTRDFANVPPSYPPQPFGGQSNTSCCSPRNQMLKSPWETLPRVPTPAHN